MVKRVAGGLFQPRELLKIEMRLTRHAWSIYLALMAPVALAYLAGPLNAGPVFNAIGFSACIAIVLGVRINRPSARWPWYLIALGQFLLAAGDVVAYNYKTFFGSARRTPTSTGGYVVARRRRLGLVDHRPRTPRGRRSPSALRRRRANVPAHSSP